MRRKFPFALCLSAFLGLILFGITLSVHASEYSPEKACTDQESWPAGSTYGAEYLGNGVDQILDSPQSAALNLLKTHYTLKTKVNPQFKRVLNYLLYRGFFQFKQLGIAYQGFQGILSDDSNRKNIELKIAALACLAQIHQKYPILNLTPQGFNGLLTLGQDPRLPEPSKLLVYEALTQHALIKVAQGSTAQEISAELKILKGSGPWESIVRMVLGARKSSASQIVSEAKVFKEEEKIPKGLKSLRNYIHFTEGQAYYNLHQYDQALEEFGLVDHKSNYFAQTLTAMSWAYLMKEDYSNAFSASSNLQLGGLQKTFNPEAYLVGAIALNESCSYYEAIQLIKKFRTTYKKTWAWLKNWVTQGQKGHVLYPALVSYLENPNQVPQNIASEWIRSPVFLAVQPAINLIESNDAALKNIWSAMTQVTHQAKHSGLRQSQLELSKMLLASRWGTSEIQHLVSRINVDLVERNRIMYEALHSVLDHLLLVESEVYDNVGDQMLDNEKESRKASEKRRLNSIKTKASSSGPSAWNWGVFSSDEFENSEIWADEIGNLKIVIKNKCK